jgi:hypothetical protein
MFGFRALELVLPFAASRAVAGHGRPPTTQELDAWIIHNEALFVRQPAVIALVDSLVETDLARSASLEAKAVAVLQGVAIVSAILVGVEFVTWHDQSSFQRASFVVSDIFALASFLQSLLATRPKVNYGYNESDIQAQADVKSTSAKAFAAGAAARRLAYVRANSGARLRLSNSVEASLGSIRNSIVAAMLALVPNLIDWTGAVLVAAIRWI